MIYDTYSKRTKRNKLLQIEQYTEIPKTLRNQIVRILNRIIEFEEWQNLWYSFCDEKGKPQNEANIDFDAQYDINEEYKSLCHKQIEEGTIEDVFDMLDIAFQKTYESILEGREDKGTSYNQAGEKLNIRLEEANVGYRLENNRIERKILHLDLALPALNILRDENFKHTKDNFYLAHQHYQNQNYGDCVVSASRSFESLLKALCTQQNLEHNPEGSTESLVKILCERLFSSDKFNKKFSQSLKFLPDVRAHFGAHGEAPQPDKETPAYMARYALHLAATNILLFMQAAEFKNKLTESELDDDIPF